VRIYHARERPDGDGRTIQCQVKLATLGQHFSGKPDNPRENISMNKYLLIGIEIARNSAGFSPRPSMIPHQFQIRLSSLLTVFLVSTVFVFPDSVRGDTAPPQAELRTFRLHNSPHSADISPDEESVVIECTIKSEGVHTGTKGFAERVQLWNFRDDKLVAEFRLPPIEVKADANGNYRDPIRSERFVRFSRNGNMVVALIDQKIHVLRTADMAELQSIQPAAPKESKVRALEVSPTSDVAAVLWITDDRHGRVEIYDLASGASLQRWETPPGSIEFTRGIVWHPDGKLLLLAIPNMWPCMSPTNHPDVFGFDVATGAIKYKLTTGLLTGSIAVTVDGRVLAVDENCLGVFANHDPKLRVFDLSTGKKIREVSGRGAGVRYLVSSSADGSRFLAFTGKVKMQFDWGDGVPRDERIDETFSVWNLSNYEGIVTSQNLRGLNAQGLRLSPKGGYVVSIGKASSVYQLPPH
jgi:WD40 repeat protein